MQLIDDQSYKNLSHTITMNKDIGFARRLRQRLADCGYSTKQTDVARLFGVSTATSWAYLNGTKLPSMARTVGIAKILRCTVEYLMTGKESETPPTEKRQDHVSRELVSLIAGMTPESRATLLNFIRASHVAEAQQRDSGGPSSRPTRQRSPRTRDAPVRIKPVQPDTLDSPAVYEELDVPLAHNALRIGTNDRSH